MVALDGVDLGDDRAGVRFDDLGTVVEVDFVTVIVGRVVAGGEDGAGVGVEVADGEGKFGGGAGVVEEVDIAAVLRGDLGAERYEFAGEVAGVVGEDHGGAFGYAFLVHPFAEVLDDALGGPREIVVVHGVGPGAGVFRAAIFERGTVFGGGDDSSDGAAAEATGAEGEFAEEAVVEFGPGVRLGEFGDAFEGDGVGAAFEQFEDVVGAGLEEVA